MRGRAVVMLFLAPIIGPGMIYQGFVNMKTNPGFGFFGMLLGLVLIVCFFVALGRALKR